MDGVSLNIPSGSLFGLIGPNGAGKSSLISILLGLSSYEAGHIQIGGLEHRQHLAVVRRLCGLAPQDPGCFPLLSVLENLQIFGAAAGLSRTALRQATEQALDATDLFAHVNSRAEHLSGGLRQRLNLALALLGQPAILLLDEPTAGVDAQSRKFILDVLKAENQRGTTIVYTSHYLAEVESLCERIAILSQGQIRYSGTMAQLGAEHSPKLEVTLKNAPNAAVCAELAQQWPHLVWAGGSFSLSTEDPSGCLNDLRSRGLSIAQMRYGAPSLESVYFALCGAQVAS